MMPIHKKYAFSRGLNIQKTGENVTIRGIQRGEFKPSANFEAHHSLPVEYRDQLIDAGVNFNAAKYGVLVPVDIHRAWHHGWGDFVNKKHNDHIWAGFFRSNPDATADEIETFFEETVKKLYIYKKYKTE
jgi:hypothetical protein